MSEEKGIPNKLWCCPNQKYSIPSPHNSTINSCTSSLNKLQPYTHMYVNIRLSCYNVSFNPFKKTSLSTWKWKQKESTRPTKSKMCYGSRVDPSFHSYKAPEDLHNNTCITQSAHQKVLQSLPWLQSRERTMSCRYLDISKGIRGVKPRVGEPICDMVSGPLQ
jgi:hypothetical protein